MTVTLTLSPGSISSSSAWIVTLGPSALSVGVTVAVVVPVAPVVAVAAVAGVGVLATAVDAGNGVGAAAAPLPGSNALVMLVLGSSPGRATQFGEVGLYWPRYRLPCISADKSGGRFLPVITDSK